MEEREAAQLVHNPGEICMTQDPPDYLSKCIRFSEHLSWSLEEGDLSWHLLTGLAGRQSYSHIIV